MNEIVEYKARPRYVSALRWRGMRDAKALRAFVGDKVEIYGNDVFIRLPEGELRAHPGDYIVSDGKGELRPMQPGLFEAMYETRWHDGMDEPARERVNIALRFQRALDETLMHLRHKRALHSASEELTRLRFSVGGEKSTELARWRIANAAGSLESNEDEAYGRIMALLSILDEKDAVKD